MGQEMNDEQVADQVRLPQWVTVANVAVGDLVALGSRKKAPADESSMIKVGSIEKEGGMTRVSTASRDAGFIVGSATKVWHVSLGAAPVKPARVRKPKPAKVETFEGPALMAEIASLNPAEQAATPAKVVQLVDFSRNGKRIGNFDNKLSGLAWLCSAGCEGAGSPRLGVKEFTPILERVTGLTKDQLITQEWGPAILPNGVVVQATLKEG